jgi:hypothetical protein
MTIRRITISVQDSVAKRIKKAAGSKPVSAWVTEVIEEHLDGTELERQWQAFAADVAPRARDERQARGLLDAMTKAARRGAA